MGATKCKHSADIVISKIKEFGLSVDTYIKKIKRIVKTERTTDIKGKTVTQLNTELLSQNMPTISPNFIDIVTWIRYLFHSNEIDIIDFMAWNEILKTQRYMKINAIVLEGYTNAGKSLIIENMIGICHPEEIPRERDNSGFHLDQLPAASCALFEEPLITPVNVGTWKLLLEGKTVKTDIKHKDKEGIPRLLIWITTAAPITTHVDSNESIQINQRVKVWLFKKRVQHRKDSHTLNSELRGRLIRKAPGFVTPQHFAYLWVTNIHDIVRRITDLDNDHVLNINRIRLTHDIFHKTNQYRKQLLKDLSTRGSQHQSDEDDTLPQVPE